MQVGSQWPAETTVTAGAASEMVYGQYYQAGVTEGEGAADCTLEISESDFIDMTTGKADAMKLFDGVGREHEEFKIKLSDGELNEALASAQRQLEEQNKLLEERFEDKKRKLREAIELQVQEALKNYD